MLGKLKKTFGLERKVVKIVAPVDGSAVTLTEVPDPAFSEEMFGRGIAIKPTVGRVVSPVDGVVSQMFDTGHAVSLTSGSGTEVLIHIGLDTVRLHGEHFTALAQTGDKVKIGDGLIDFDIAAISAAGYNTITPIVICNSDDYKTFDIKSDIDVKIGDEIITLGGW